MTGQFWDVPSGGFVVDGTIINLSGSDTSDSGTMTDELRFILDSGVYATFAPPEYLRAIYSPVPGSFLLEDGTWSVPCDTRMHVSVLLGGTAYEIHPIDMAEVYAVEEEEDGTGKPLCKGLFQSNSIPRFTVDGSLTSTAAFLIGLNVLRNLYVLHHYGDIDRSVEPYVQIIPATDMAEAFAELDVMNAARINAFWRARIAATSSSQRETSPPMEPAMRTVRVTRSWLVVSSACFAVLYWISRWFHLRRWGASRT
ncbi:hypothetical protein C8T65DRAFT_640350 [Cerioporus squamosus]|nr:hypothetical protein C8T65DRAFT_640350 [Cerioporus squamosus]